MKHAAARIIAASNQAVNVFLIVLLVSLASPCYGDMLTYDISYNPLSGVTTLWNSAASLADLPYETLVGSLEGEELFLNPGEGIRIDSKGEITAITLLDLVRDSWTIETRIYHGGSLSVAPAYSGIISVNYGSNRFLQYVFDGRGNIREFSTVGRKGIRRQFPIDGKGKATNFAISLGSDDYAKVSGGGVHFIMRNGTGALSQRDIQLLFGGLQSTDDTGNFTSVFTPTVRTGIVPEPSGVALLASLLVGLRLFRKKRTF